MKITEREEFLPLAFMLIIILAGFGVLLIAEISKEQNRLIWIDGCAYVVKNSVAVQVADDDGDHLCGEEKK